MNQDPSVMHPISELPAVQARQVKLEAKRERTAEKVARYVVRRLAKGVTEMPPHRRRFFHEPEASIDEPTFAMVQAKLGEIGVAGVTMETFTDSEGEDRSTIYVTQVSADLADVPLEPSADHSEQLELDI